MNASCGFCEIVMKPGGAHRACAEPASRRPASANSRSPKTRRPASSGPAYGHPHYPTGWRPAGWRGQANERCNKLKVQEKLSRRASEKQNISMSSTTSFDGPGRKAILAFCFSIGYVQCLCGLLLCEFSGIVAPNLPVQAAA
jgi:hypothetical protein